jgi:hypothetical protein
MEAGAHAGTVEAIERLAEEGTEADDVLRAVIELLHERLDAFVRVSFVEESALVPGPAAGEEAATTSVPVRYEGAHVADLEVAGTPDTDDRALLERVAEIIAPFALVGWDTGGLGWEP